jgi:hypothetical protein
MSMKLNTIDKVWMVSTVVMVVLIIIELIVWNLCFK